MEERITNWRELLDQLRQQFAPNPEVIAVIREMNARLSTPVFRMEKRDE